MNMNTLDELTIPQPPYRMKRPQAVLAVAEEPVVASTEGEALLPVPEAPLPVPEAPPASPAEVIAERSAAMEAATKAARSAVEEAPPIADAEAAKQDGANRGAAVGQIDAAAADANARVAALKEGLVKMAGEEKRTPEQQADDQATAQRLREERDQRRAAEAAATEELRQQEEQARKADIELKKSVTRGQTAAIKEDAVREEKKLEEGIEFKQPEETPAQKAGREALEMLNAFKDVKDASMSQNEKVRSKVKPGEVEFYKEQANLSQKRAEAAKRGEAIPEDRVDMAKVEAAKAAKPRQGRPEAAKPATEQGPALSVEEAERKAAEAKAAGKPLDAAYYAQEAERARAEAKNKAAEAKAAGKPLEAAYQADEAKRKPAGKGEASPQAAERAQEIKDAESFEDLYAKMRDAGEYLVSPSTGKPVDIEREIAIIENYRKTGSQFMQVEGGIGQPTRGLGLRDKVVALRAKEQPVAEAAPEPAATEATPEKPVLKVGDKTPYGEVIAIGPDGKPKIRYEAPAVEASKTPEAAGPTGLEEAFDAEGNLKLVPLEERPAAVPAEVGSERVDIKPGTPEGDAVAAARSKAEKFVAEAKSAAPVERTPAEQEELRQLQEEVRRQNRGEATPAAPVEGAPTPREQKLEDELTKLRAEFDEYRNRREASRGGQPPRGPEQPPAGAGDEGAPPTPERATRIGEIGEQQGLSFWEKFKAERAAGAEDWKAALAAILAKKWEGRLDRRNEKIKKWEESGQGAAKKGALGMAKSWLWDESWANYHRWRGREAYKKQEAWNDARVRRENSRDEALNQGAARIDRLLDSQLERIDQFAFQRDEQEDGLKKLHAKHQEYTELLALAATPDERSQVRGILDTIEKDLKETAEKKRGAEEKWQAERKRAAKEQARKEQLLSYAVRPARIDTTPKKYDWLVQRKTRPGGSPKPRAGRIPTPGVAA